MGWMNGITNSRPNITQEYIETTGAVLGGRDGFDAFPDADSTYDGTWQGTVFNLQLLNGDTPRAEINVRYRPVPTNQHS